MLIRNSYYTCFDIRLAGEFYHFIGLCLGMFATWSIILVVVKKLKIVSD